ncbi:hypothetical protein [Actinokineospora pegani]|uniref:hypothetical protein n=1 Tax=Actinokineospora pegani TaxID=2654637 RepID=UPI0038B2A0CE
MGIGYGALVARAFPQFEVAVPLGQLALVALGALALAQLASVLPARRAATTSPLIALAAA